MAKGFANTVEALNALKQKLAAIQWNGKPAFEKVALFDMTDLLTALQELLNYANRVCLVVHDIEHFETEKKGNDLHCRQRREIALLIADKHFADRQKALVGDNQTPGALNLKDLVLNNIVGLLQEGIYIEPSTGEQMSLEKKVRNELTGRVAFVLRVRLVGGNVIKSLGPQPIP